MLKKTVFIAGVFLLSGCSHTPPRQTTGSSILCAKLKYDLNTAYRRHTPGELTGKSVSPGQRASEMQLYEKDCANYHG